MIIHAKEVKFYTPNPLKSLKPTRHKLIVV